MIRYSSRLTLLKIHILVDLFLKNVISNRNLIGMSEVKIRRITHKANKIKTLILPIMKNS